MNPGNVIWTGYFKKARNHWFLIELWRVSPMWVRLVSVVSISAMIVMAGIVATKTLKTQNYHVLVAAIFGGVALLAKRKAVLEFEKRFNSLDNSSTLREGDLEHQSGRYLLFKSHLVANLISEKQAEEFLAVISARIDYQSSKNILSKKYLTFMIGMASGVFVTWSKNLESVDLIYYGIMLSLPLLLIYSALSFIPSKDEAMRELACFLRQYCFDLKYAASMTNTPINRTPGKRRADD